MPAGTNKVAMSSSARVARLRRRKASSSVKAEEYHLIDGHFCCDRGRTFRYAWNRRRQRWESKHGLDLRTMELGEASSDAWSFVSGHPGGLNGDTVDVPWEDGTCSFVGQDKVTRKNVEFDGTFVKGLIESPQKSLKYRIAH